METTSGWVVFHCLFWWWWWLFVCGLDFISLISLYLKSWFCFAFNFFPTVLLYVKRMECQYHANKESREQKAGHKKPGSPSYLLCGTMVDHRICQAGRHLRQSPSLPLVPSAVSSEAQLMRTLGVLQACSKQHQATCHKAASGTASCYLSHTR